MNNYLFVALISDQPGRVYEKPGEPALVVVATCILPESRHKAFLVCVG